MVKHIDIGNPETRPIKRQMPHRMSDITSFKVTSSKCQVMDLPWWKTLAQLAREKICHNSHKHQVQGEKDYQ